MKLIAVNGSPRVGKTTAAALHAALNSAREAVPQLETELIELGGRQLNGCIACGYCRDKLDCSQKDDFIPLINKLAAPEVGGLLLGSPVYMGGMSSQLKAFLDRSVMFRRNSFLFHDMPGGAVAVGGSRNGGQELTLQSIHAALLIHDMIVVGDGQPGAHFGGAACSREGIEADPGLATAKATGRRIALLIQKMNS